MINSVYDWLGAAAFLVILLVLLSSCSALNVEKQNYRILEKDGLFEIRQYEPCIVAETQVYSDFEKGAISHLAVWPTTLAARIA